MQFEKINQWLTLVANVGVIVGIFFLATEIRQTNELMESERRFNRLQVVLDGNAGYFENPLLTQAFRKASAGEELSADEETALRFQTINIISTWQWTWLELPEDEFPLEQYRSSLQTEWFRERFEERLPYLLPEFASFAEESLLPN